MAESISSGNELIDGSSNVQETLQVMPSIGPTVLKCSICGQRALYFCHFRGGKCSSRVMCQRCILKHCPTHSPSVLLLEDLLGDALRNEEAEAQKQLKRLLEKFCDEQSRISGKMEMLEGRLDAVVEEAVAALRGRLIVEKELILKTFAGDYETKVLTGHRRLEDETGRYHATLARLSDDDVCVEELEKLLSELAICHERYTGSRKNSDLDILRMFGDKWKCEQLADRDNVRQQAATVLGKVNMPAMLWQQASNTFRQQENLQTEQDTPKNVTTTPSNATHQQQQPQAGQNQNFAPPAYGAPALQTQRTAGKLEVANLPSNLRFSQIQQSTPPNLEKPIYLQAQPAQMQQQSQLQQQSLLQPQLQLPPPQAPQQQPFSNGYFIDRRNPVTNRVSLMAGQHLSESFVKGGLASPNHPHPQLLQRGSTGGTSN
eukprot:TRINITY_DN15271_c0_g2_i1.p1 TRINITY_DN15271_c0_g2~~TRINITY_DN15271_c0_g2_i1.p1  ORF type:complete len:431 (-),score=111.12 TRINITY_DN15271_c0_g2_i1:121-1413(-)